MARFLSEHLADLTRQLSYAPPERRRRHMDAAEHLYWKIDPARNYPLDFLIYQITGYRPDSGSQTMVVGEAVQNDLLRMVEQISESLEDRAEDADSPVYDLQGVRKKLNVSAKTVSRYRRKGLFARRLIFSDGRMKLAFLPQSVDRFLQSQGRRVGQAAGFSRIDERTRHEMILRARRIAARVEASPFQVARHLSRKYGRSTEAVRQLLLRNDEADPRVAIFRNHTPPLTDKQQRVIHRAYHRGVSVARLADRFGKARSAIYRTINRRRAKALHDLEIRYVYQSTFDLPDAEEVILGLVAPPQDIANDSSTTGSDKAAGNDGSPSLATSRPADALSQYFQQLSDQPRFQPQVEKNLFVRYNFLKYRSAALREKLDRYQPRSSKLDRIETYLRWAVAIKHDLVRGHLRQVVAVARKHLSGQGGFDSQAMTDLISEGNLVLMEAIETYNPSRDAQFSTYLTWALMRRFARAAREQVRPETARGLSGGEYWPAAMNPNVAAIEHAEQVAYTLRQLLAELETRERRIITRHFGLNPQTGASTEPQTLAEIAAELDISAERARQIEHRAMAKLRQAAARLDLPAPSTDPLSSS